MSGERFVISDKDKDAIIWIQAIPEKPKSSTKAQSSESKGTK